LRTDQPAQWTKGRRLLRVKEPQRHRPVPGESAETPGLLPRRRFGAPDFLFDLVPPNEKDGLPDFQHAISDRTASLKWSLPFGRVKVQVFFFLRVVSLVVPDQILDKNFQALRTGRILRPFFHAHYPFRGRRRSPLATAIQPLNWAVGNPVEPARHCPLLADRSCLPDQDEERGLKGIFDVFQSAREWSGTRTRPILHAASQSRRRPPRPGPKRSALAGQHHSGPERPGHPRGGGCGGPRRQAVHGASLSASDTVGFCCARPTSFLRGICGVDVPMFEAVGAMKR